MNKVSAIVLAAGNGSRMQSQQKKQFMEIQGKPILWYPLFQLEQSPVDEVILVTGEEDIPYCKKNIVEKYGFSKVKHIVAGGKERYHSVYNGLQKVSGSQVLIHDGARPMLTETIIKKIVKDADSVSVKEFETEEDNTIQIEVIVSSDDMPLVIGSHGKNISAIRTIVQASSTINTGKKVIINVDSY